MFCLALLHILNIFLVDFNFKTYYINIIKHHKWDFYNIPDEISIM